MLYQTKNRTVDSLYANVMYAYCSSTPLPSLETLIITVCSPHLCKTFSTETTIKMVRRLYSEAMHLLGESVLLPLLLIFVLSMCCVYICLSQCAGVSFFQVQPITTCLAPNPISHWLIEDSLFLFNSSPCNVNIRPPLLCHTCVVCHLVVFVFEFIEL